ncbi:hypothetical protein [Blastococcus sp. TML/C7B]|nr:hypothetical protein [Blastococcus sp. TML/C7B]
MTPPSTVRARLVCWWRGHRFGPLRPDGTAACRRCRRVVRPLDR